MPDPVTVRREIDCGDDITVRACLPADATPEVLEALIAIGRAAARKLDETRAPQTEPWPPPADVRRHIPYPNFRHFPKETDHA